MKLTDIGLLLGFSLGATGPRNLDLSFVLVYLDLWITIDVLSINF
jgi:hypothetical protein